MKKSSRIKKKNNRVKPETQQNPQKFKIFGTEILSHILKKL